MSVPRYQADDHRVVSRRADGRRVVVRRTTDPLMDNLHLDHGNRVLYIVRDVQPNRRGNLHHLQRVGNLLVNMNLGHHGLKVPDRIHPLIRHDHAQPTRARALLNTGSSMNIMTEKFANSLDIKQRRCAVLIGTLDNITTTAKHQQDGTIRMGQRRGALSPNQP